MGDFVEVVVDSIRVSLMSQQRIVILREKNADRYLPIWIGVNESESITIALQEVEVARPLTHDLIKNIFKAVKAKILRVEVQEIKDDTYYGGIVVEVDDREITIDSRPSDALAIAVRTHVPILVSTEVMDNAGMEPEMDIRKFNLAEDGDISGRISKEGEDRLGIFKDFLEGLDSGESIDPQDIDQ